MDCSNERRVSTYTWFQDAPRRNQHPTRSGALVVTTPEHAIGGQLVGSDKSTRAVTVRRHSTIIIE